MKKPSLKMLALFLSTIILIAIVPIGYANDVTELLIDPGFENQNGWSTITGTGIQYVTEEARSGQFSLKTFNGTYFGMSDMVEFDASKLYKFSVFIKGFGSLRTWITYYDEYGVQISKTTFGANDSRGTCIDIVTLNNEDWTEKTINITKGLLDTSYDIKYFKINFITYFTASEGHTNFWFDDASLTAIDEAELEMDLKDNLVPGSTMDNTNLWDNTSRFASWTTDEYHSYPSSVRLDMTGGASPTYIRSNGYFIPFDKTMGYEISVWLKSTVDGSKVDIAVQNAPAAWWYAAGDAVAVSTEWQKYTVILYVPDNATTATAVRPTIQPDSTGTGYVYVDDITIKAFYIPDSIGIAGNDIINLPNLGTLTEQYAAVVKDTAGRIIDEEVEWSVESNYPEHITLSETGLLSVSDSVLPGTQIKVKAALKSDAQLFAEKLITTDYVVSEQYKTDLQTLLTTGTETSITTFLTAAENARPLSVIGLEIADFNSSNFDDADRTAIVQNLITNKKDSLEENVLLFNDYVFVQLINTSDISNMTSILEAYDTSMNIGIVNNSMYVELCTSEMNAAKESAVNMILADAPYTSVEEIISAVDEKITAAYFSNIATGKVEDALAYTSTKLGLNLENSYIEYAALAANNAFKIAINKAIAGGTYQSFAEIKNTFLSAYNENKQPAAPQGSHRPSGGGGGGGSSIGSGKNTMTVPVNPPVVSEVKETEKEEMIFSDLTESSWAEEAILSLYEKGIINGYEDKTFGPDNMVKREEFIKMLLEALKLTNNNAACDFADVNDGEWYYRYIASAADLGIAQGINETEFGVGQNITREQMATFVMRALKAANLISETEKSAGLFDDDSSISEYAREAVYTMKKLGIINGYPDGTYLPSKKTSRAEAAYVIYTVFKMQ